MPMRSPYQIVLSGPEQAELEARARSVRGPYRDRLRAAIVLAAAAGQANAAIARQLGVCTGTVLKWRRRFALGRLASLKDAPRSRRPPVFTAADRAEVIALACALPAESGVPLARWSGPEGPLPCLRSAKVLSSRPVRWPTLRGLRADLRARRRQVTVTGRCAAAAFNATVEASRNSPAAEGINNGRAGAGWAGSGGDHGVGRPGCG